MTSLQPILVIYIGVLCFREVFLEDGVIYSVGV